MKPNRSVKPVEAAAKKRPVTWYVVADGRNARIVTLTPGRRGDEVVLVHEMATELLPTHEIMADRAGRVHDSHGEHRHAADPQTDAHREQKARFSRKVIRYLEESQQTRGYDRLVLFAPPEAMGDLRAAMSGMLRNKVASEVTKDLSFIPTSQLAEHLAAVSVG